MFPTPGCRVGVGRHSYHYSPLLRAERQTSVTNGALHWYKSKPEELRGTHTSAAPPTSASRTTYPHSYKLPSYKLVQIFTYSTAVEKAASARAFDLTQYHLFIRLVALPNICSTASRAALVAHFVELWPTTNTVVWGSNHIQCFSLSAL